MRHRHARKAGVALLALAVTAALFAPAAVAKKPAEKRGGKKPVAEVVSFDEATMELMLTWKDGSSTSETVDAGVQIKVEHRGNHSRGKGHGNPSRGSLDDLAAGAKVLRVKRNAGVVVKLRLRRAPAAPIVAEPTDGEDDGTGDVEDGTDGTDEVDDGTGDVADGTEPDDGVDDGADDGTGDVEDGTEDPVEGV